MPYRLEKYTNTENPIYQQVLNYYHYCDYRRNMTTATMEGKTTVINEFLNTTGLEDLRKIDNHIIDLWVDHMQERGNCPSTINMRLKTLIAMLKWERDDNVHMDNLSIARICLLKELPARRRWFKAEEIEQVLALADRREWLIIKIAFDCGLRLNELRNLKLENIEGNKLYYVGKGRKARSGILSPEVIVRLDDWVKRNHITNYLWPSKKVNGKPLSEPAFRDAIERSFMRAGFKMTPHDLRRSFAADFLEIGASEREIQHVMGHASINTTERYLQQLDDKEAQRLYAAKYSRSTANLR